MTDKEKLQRVLILVRNLSENIDVLADIYNFKELGECRDYIVLTTRLFVEFEKEIRKLDLK